MGEGPATGEPVKVIPESEKKMHSQLIEVLFFLCLSLNNGAC